MIFFPIILLIYLYYKIYNFLQSLAFMLGKDLFSFMCNAENTYEQLHQIILGLASTGIWLSATKMNLLAYGLISVLAQNVNIYLYFLNIDRD